MSIKHEVKEVARLAEIVTVLFEEGLDFIVYELELHALVPFMHRFKRKFIRQIKRNFEVSLVNSIERLGGTFVKMGQILSTRPDLIPEHYTHVLAGLQSGVEAAPFEAVKPLLVKELGMSLDKVFKRIYRTPIAAASIAQVHKAILHDGTVVAVKVQRPGIEQQIRIDFKIFRRILRLLKKSKYNIKHLHMQENYEEIKRYTLRELDFRIEASNM